MLIILLKKKQKKMFFKFGIIFAIATVALARPEPEHVDFLSDEYIEHLNSLKTTWKVIAYFSFIFFFI